MADLDSGVTLRSVRRLRRLRASDSLRALRRESHLHAAQLVQPLFIAEDLAMAGPIDSMPGQRRLAPEELPEVAQRLWSGGVRAILLFGLPRSKDALGSGAADPSGILPRAIEEVKLAAPGLVVITDLCLCAFTDHGHCAPLREGRVLNDEALETLGQAAVVHAAAGADLVAPSGMLDGAVAAIRRALDGAGLVECGILSYSVKYASAFYGPFRDAASSAPRCGDRRAHQMDPANGAEAVAEAEADLAEGADAIMVKPAGPCLDVVRRLAERFPEVPLAAYQVSGEYAALVAASQRGWLDLRAVALESLLGIRRAGGSIIISYFAAQAAQWLGEEGA
jgi:porphobilinogen synthase